ncbi:MAG: hypothetical protein WC479_00545 [Candidatus Izemoplasmatales bacterium]
MTVLSPADLVALRSHPHKSTFYMSIFKPELVYTGQVAGTPAYGAREITVTDISGDIADIEEGFTVKVKDADGNLVCKRRYRSRVGQILKLDENVVSWSVSYTIEVYRQYELWTIFPYIDAADDYRFYKDYDIAYSDQNIRIPPVAIAGSHRAGFLDGGSITFDLDCSDSYPIAHGASATMTYLWSCDTGVIDSATSETTTITFTAAGQHIVKLTVTDSMDSSQSTYRIFFVHTRTGADSPHLNFTLESIDCSWSSGGCTLSTILKEAANIEDIEDGALVVIWSENWYNNTKQNIGAFNEVRFVGYILSESIQRTVTANEVSFDIGTIDALMKNMRMFSLSLEAVPSGSLAVTWYQFPYNTLTVARAVHHLWKWHSTLFEIADVFLPTENLYTMTACDDMTDGNLFTLTDWVYENGIFAKLYCDQVSGVHLDIDSLILDDTTRDALETYFDITTQDWRLEEGLRIDRNKDPKAALVSASGVANISGTFTPLIAQSPGVIPNNVGNDIINVERLVLYSQSQLNTLVGRLYAIANSEISEIGLSFVGDYPITLSPKVWYTLTIPASYTRRGIDIDVRMLCREVTYRVSITSGTIYPLCIFEVDVDSLDGITVEYTEEPETPYSPIPAYTPAIPYVPNIPPIYPIVPMQPYPNYPGGSPTTIVPSPATIPAISALCRTNLAYSPNGPYFVYSGEAPGGSTIIPISFFLRGTNYTNYTRYTLNGYFYDVDDDTGEYEITTDDDFYEIYALDATGTRVATGVKDPVVGSGYQRTGRFNVAAGVDISAIEFVCEVPTLASHAHTLNDNDGWYPAVYPYSTSFGEYTYIENADGGLVQQLDKLSCGVANPPWIYSVNSNVTLSSVWNLTKYPAWFNWVTILQNSEEGLVSHYMEAKTPWGLVVITNDTDQFSTKIKYPSHGSLYDKWQLRYRVYFTNINEAWVTQFSWLTPIVPKITIDSLLLWNVCSHS